MNNNNSITPVVATGSVTPNTPTNLGQMNPFDFDTKIQQTDALLSKNNIPQDQIDAITQGLQQKYQDVNGGSAGSTGVLGTGFGSGTVDEAQANLGITPDTYKTQQATSGFIAPFSPLMPGDNPLLGVPKVVPNAVSDLGNVIGGTVGALSHPLNTVVDIYKNPVMLAGPVATNLLEGTGNALGDLFAGNFSKAGIDLLSGADKAWTGFVDHPILSLPIFHVLGDVSDALGITKPAVEIDPETGLAKPPVTLKSDIASKVNTVKNALSDPKATALAMSQKLIAPFKTLMPKATGDAAATIIANRVGTTLGQITNMDTLEKTMAAKPDFMQQQAELSLALDTTKNATDNTISKITDQTNTALQVLETNKAQADDNLNTAHQEDVTFAKGIVTTNAAGTPESVQSSIGTKISNIEGANNAGYGNLKAPDGTPIPVKSTAPLADALQGFVNDNKELFNPKAVTSVNNDIFRLRAQDYARQGMSLPEIYKTMIEKGEGTAEQFSNNPANFLDKPLTADQLKIVRDRVAGNITQGLTPAAKSTALALYGKATSGAFDDMMSQSVDPINPNGADAVRSADTAFKNLIATKAKYGITEDENGNITGFNASKVEDNFDQFKQDFPDAAKLYSQMKAAEIVRDAQTTSKTGIQSINYSKLNDGINENGQFVDPSTRAQIQAIIQKSYADQALHDQVISGANKNADTLQSTLDQTVATLKENQEQTSRVLQTKLAEAKTNAKISPTDPETFEKTLQGTKTYTDFQKLSQTSGISPSDLGSLFLKQSAARNFGENVDISKLSTAKILSGAKGMLNEYDALGGTSKTAALKDEMFGDSNATMEKIRSEVERANQATKEGGRAILKNTGSAIAGGLVSMFGHALVGTSLVLRSIRELLSEKVTESNPQDVNPANTSFKSIGKKVGSAIVPVANSEQSKQ